MAYGILNAEQLDYQANDDTYVQEISMLRDEKLGRLITIKKDDKNRHYRLERTDNAGGDIAGWWYYELGGAGKVLIIND